MSSFTFLQLFVTICIMTLATASSLVSAVCQDWLRQQASKQDLFWYAKSVSEPGESQKMSKIPKFLIWFWIRLVWIHFQFLLWLLIQRRRKSLELQRKENACKWIRRKSSAVQLQAPTQRGWNLLAFQT